MVCSIALSNLASNIMPGSHATAQQHSRNRVWSNQVTTVVQCFSSEERYSKLPLTQGGTVTKQQHDA